MVTARISTHGYTPPQTCSASVPLGHRRGAERAGWPGLSERQQLLHNATAILIDFASFSDAQIAAAIAVIEDSSDAPHTLRTRAATLKRALQR